MLNKLAGLVRPGGSIVPYSAPSSTVSASPAFSKSQASLFSLKSDSASFQKLEKHLDDVKKGRGYLSKQTGNQLIGLNIQNATTLNQTDPQAGLLYSSLISGFGYQQNARLVSNVKEANENIGRVRELSQIDQKQATADLIEQVTGKPVAADPAAVASSYDKNSIPT